jgi:sulfatase modifying factor 1
MRSTIIIALWIALSSLAFVCASAQAPGDLTLDLGSGVRMTFVRIPNGTFLMGSPLAEKEREADETLHEVTISRPYYISKTLVTVDQFAAFVQDSGYKTDAEVARRTNDFSIRDGKFNFLMNPGGSWRRPSFNQAGSHPVVHVSWNDAKAFCAWLSKKTGRTIVLPTEAQWEYAARAGTRTAYPWGEDPNDGQGWINGADQTLKQQLTNPPVEMEFFNWRDGFTFTSPVGSFKANTFGVHDMTGNVWQWVEDGYGPYGEGPALDPRGAVTGNRRVLRGGSWMFHARYSRLAGYRNHLAPDYADGRSGFRVAALADGD